MSERYEGQTFYELLEVTPQAGPMEIYNAYQRARSTYSPNSPALYTMFTPEEAHELMALIEEAYQTLSHQARRRDYDIKLGLASNAAAPAAPVESERKSPPPAAVGAANDAWVGPVKVSEKLKDESPSGAGRTKFSTYKVDKEFEKELMNLDECSGVHLRKLREYKGVSLEQLSEEIRVAKSTLAALESDDLNALPVAVFTRGFVVQYARVLGFDENKIANAYMKFFKARKVVR